MTSKQMERVTEISIYVLLGGWFVFFLTLMFAIIATALRPMEKVSTFKDSKRNTCFVVAESEDKQLRIDPVDCSKIK